MSTEADQTAAMLSTTRTRYLTRGVITIGRLNSHYAPLRHANALDDRQRSKIEWMSKYVNDTIAEQKLPAEWEVVLTVSATNALSPEVCPQPTPPSNDNA